MNSNELPIKFNHFLLDAKRNTSATLINESIRPNSELQNSKQVEWSDGDWFYRDICCGTSFFTGSEVVYLGRKPLWSMAYSGGTNQEMETHEIRSIYAFLRSALQNISSKFPVRGPPHFSDMNYSYRMSVQGDLAAFSGHEEILKNGATKYSLTFAGGMVRWR